MGGAAGHMKHPFEVPGVKTGPEMLAIIEKVKDYLEADGLADTKIDGTNVSFKLVDTEDGGKEFAVDRGSSQPSDVFGITARNVRDKFGEGHGMIRAIEILLKIFNEALPSLEPELKALGVWDDPTRFFNTEYVEILEGKEATNVVKYDHNFFKIHGINQFFAKPAQAFRIRKGIGMDRPGAERPPDVDKKQKSIGVPYDKAAMESLKEKLSPFAVKENFRIYTLIQVLRKPDNRPINFTESLNKPIPITFSREEVITKPLGEWLGEAVIPGPKQYVVDLAGNKMLALGKKTYQSVLGARRGTEELSVEEQVSLDELFDDEEAKRLAIGGAIAWHATRLLGNDIMDEFTSEEMGDMKKNEGIVAKMPEYNFDIKITGNFILEGGATPFDDRGDPAAEAEPEPELQKVVGIFPGSFKPPHYGHFTVLQFLKEQGAQEIKVLVSAPKQEVRSQKITPAKAAAVWEEYLAVEPIGVPVEVIVSSSPSPIGAAYDYIEKLAPAGETILLGTSEADAARYPQETLDQSAAKNPSGNIKVQAAVAPACKPPEGCDTIGKMSAGMMRNIIDKHPDVSDIEVQLVLSHMHPNLSDEKKMEIFNFLVETEVKKTPEEPDLPPSSLAEALKMLKEEIQKEKLEEEDLEEVSTMAGGNVEGHALSTFPAVDMEKENEKEKRRSHKLKKIAEIYSKLETNYQYIPEERKKDMKINELLKEKKKIEEMALRRYIRSTIRKKTTNHAAKLEEERKLRLAIRKMIQEVKVEDSPTESTGINKLVSVLKIILPTIEKAYKGLTTDKEQRDSFIKHYIHAIINTLSPQKAMRTAYEPATATVAESVLKEQEFTPDPAKYIDIGVRTDKEKEEEDATAAAEKEAEDKISKEEEKEAKKADSEAIIDVAGEKQPFPEIPGFDMTGRDWSVDAYKKTVDAVIRGSAALHNDKDEEHFEDYLITNILLYKDGWEDDISGELPDVTTPEYEAARAEKEKFTGGGEEMAPPEEEMAPPEEEMAPPEEEEAGATEETLEETIKSSIYDAVAKVINV